MPGDLSVFQRLRHFSVCGGGEPVNKLAENGTFASTETKYCRLTKMRPTDLVLDAIEHAQQSGGEAVNSDGAQLARVGAYEGLGKHW